MSATSERVGAGAALLDGRLPGWRDLVDVDRLDLAVCDECVLGQIFGDYSRGVDALGLTQADAIQLGFDRAPRGSWNTLTSAWRFLIRSARGW